MSAEKPTDYSYTMLDKIRQDYAKNGQYDESGAIMRVQRELNDLQAERDRLQRKINMIAAYDPPDKIRDESNEAYGLDPDEAIEMAYENVLATAKQAAQHAGEGE